MAEVVRIDGELALERRQVPQPYRRGWPWRRRWYLTGDTGTRDEDGFFRFSSRDDDVIIMAGYRIGPAAGRPDPPRQAPSCPDGTGGVEDGTERLPGNQH